MLAYHKDQDYTIVYLSAVADCGDGSLLKNPGFVGRCPYEKKEIGAVRGNRDLLGLVWGQRPANVEAGTVHLDLDLVGNCG